MFLAKFPKRAPAGLQPARQRQAGPRGLQSVMRNADRAYPAIIGGRDGADREDDRLALPGSAGHGGRPGGGLHPRPRGPGGRGRRGRRSRSGLSPTRKRAEKLVRLAELIRRDRFEFLALLGLEIGKDWYEAEAEIGEAIDFCEYYARLALQPLPVPAADPHARSRTTATTTSRWASARSSPPWNFPLAILAGMTMAAVVSGNTVVLKPSSDTPVIAPRLVELCAEAGIPGRRASTWCRARGGEIGDYLVTHPEIRFVAFTGSADVGLRINEPRRRRAAARWMTRSSPRWAARTPSSWTRPPTWRRPSAGSCRSAFGFQGQKCSACSRLLRASPGPRPVAGGGRWRRRQRSRRRSLGGSLHLHRSGGQPAGHAKRSCASSRREGRGRRCWRADTRWTGTDTSSPRPCSRRPARLASWSRRRSSGRCSP